MKRYKIAFSHMILREKIPSGSPLWGSFNASFRNLELEPYEIADLIYTGHAYTTWHKNGWRNCDNYILGQHLALDFDTEDHRSTIDHLAKDIFVSKYASLIYTTPSHKPEAPRARVLFLLDTPIHQAKNYSLAASAILWLFNGADSKAKDAARYFYGSIDCDLLFINSVLPLDVLKDIAKRYRDAFEAKQRESESERKMNGSADILSIVETCIGMAQEGERNNLGFWLACRLAENGIPKSQAEYYMRLYQSKLRNIGKTEYSLHEAMASLHSAYRKVG